MAKSGHKGISRIDCPQRKTVGWYVRVRLKNVTKSKFISDSVHGGKEVALEKAVEVRNQLYAAHTKKWILTRIARRAFHRSSRTRTSPES
jgi:hypothetical protein